MDPAENQEKGTFKEAQEDVRPVVVRREPEREILTWVAPARPFKVRDRQFFVTVFAIAGIVGLVLFLAEGFMPVLLVVALVFLYYVLSTVKPESLEYKITSKGVKVYGKLTEWQAMNKFWFAKRFDNEILIIETITLPGRLEIVVDNNLKDSIKREMSAYVPYEEVPASGLDKITDWFSKKLPGNK